MDKETKQYFEKILECLDRLEGRADKTDAKLDRMESRMDRFETRMDRFETRMARLELEFRDMKSIQIRMETKHGDQLSVIWDKVCQFDDHIKDKSIHVQPEI